MVLFDGLCFAEYQCGQVSARGSVRPRSVIINAHNSWTTWYFDPIYTNLQDMTNLLSNPFGQWILINLRSSLGVHITISWLLSCLMLPPLYCFGRGGRVLYLTIFVLRNLVPKIVLQSLWWERERERERERWREREREREGERERDEESERERDIERDGDGYSI